MPKETEVEEGPRVFNKKYMKRLKESGWVEAAESMDTAELKKKIVQFEQAVSEQEQLREKDIFLQNLKEEVKERNSVYMEPINELVAKIKYSVFVLEGRGSGSGNL
jgi:hypothetical protein